MDKKVLRNLSYGVYVVTTKTEDKKVGCIANSIIQVTSEPVTIAISINHDNYTNECIKKSGYFGVSILKESTDPKIIGEFGFKSSRNTDKFKNILFEEIENIPVIKDSCGYITCKVIDKIETATHTIFLGEAIKAGDYTSESPMTYKFYHEKLKGTSPKNAPTYQKDELVQEKTTKKRFKCSVCGYVYEGESLPEDFICPICGQPHTVFYEIN